MADGDQRIIPVAPNVPYPLGRNVNHDPRNRQYRALTAAPVTTAPRTRPWHRSDLPFDQIDSNCTAEAAVGLLRTQPHTRPFGHRHFDGYDDEHERVALYQESRRYDPWPGEAYDGTSTDAPFKLLRQRGVITGWAWLFGVDELREHLMHYGAAVVGTVWYWSMFDPNPKTGVVPVDPGSGAAGGHAYEVVFCHPKHRWFEIVNSWGSEWGKRGRARIPYEDMGHLLAEQGEAVTVRPGLVG